MALYLIDVFHILRITHRQSGVKTSEVLFPPLPNMEEREFGTELNSKCNVWDFPPCVQLPSISWYPFMSSFTLFLKDPFLF